ncbi:MAG: hypothetical protein WDN28_27405 [Chthoniobacter sp.]
MHTEVVALHAASSRELGMARRSPSSNRSQSSRVVSQPLLKRSTRDASSALICIATSTCEVCSLPLAQAEPVETA